MTPRIEATSGAWILFFLREFFQSRSRVAMFHRRDVEIRGLDVRDREERKRRELGEIDRLQVAAATGTDFDAPILPLGVRRGGDETFAAVLAVDARVRVQLPRARTE